MPTLDVLQVNDQQVEKFGTLIYDRTGIRISPQKKSLLSNRLRRRLRATQLTCFDQYYQLLRRLKADDAEWDAFLQEITTHETYLFRDPNHWQWLSETYLPQIQQEVRGGERRPQLRIWSAACSNGDEAYTIACCLASKLAQPSQWTIEIVGTDIGVDAVAQARAGVFNARSMKLVPAELRRRYFTPAGDGSWTAKETLKRWMRFQRHNLIEPLQTAPFDLIFLKNVMIYFDKDSKRKVIGHLERLLQPGGKLVSGPAEGVSDLLDRFERQKPWLHAKPAAASRHAPASS
jgi:chemotaxis protein methyltransferase CheR